MATIRCRNNSNWQVQIRRRGQPPVAKTFKSKAAAEQWARYLESEIDRGIYQDRSEAERTTIGQLIDRYLKEVTPHKKSASKERRRLTLLKAHFGAFTAAQLQRSHIAAYRDLRLRQGKAGGTVLKDLNSISHVLDVAIKDWGLPLAVNPAKLVRRPASARGRDRRLAAGEEERLLAACRTSKALLLRNIVILAIETGMRLGELLSLDWKNVDLNAQVATLPVTKNGDARRVPLSRKAIEVLKETTRHISNSRVFWTWKCADSFEYAWRRAAQAAKISDLRFHDLRHEATSRFFERGFTIMEVSAITGHKTLQMLKRYTHLNVEHFVHRLG